MDTPHPASERLADFILTNLEAIVSAWEEFARANWPTDEAPDPVDLRDNADNMLRAVAADMKSAQSLEDQKQKSEGNVADPALDGAALKHAKERLAAGFDIVKVVAEFRALRASVMRMWQAQGTPRDAEQGNELVRFNEAIDHLVATSVETHSARVEQGRRLFLGIIGHDLRQPLSSVRLLASVLVRSGPGADFPTIASKIQSGVDAMDALVRDLLDLSGSQLGKPMTMYPAMVDLRELAHEMVARMETVRPDKAFTLATEGDLSGRWDPYRLRQLLSNLLGNAVSHGDTAGAVHLSLCAEGDSVELKVQNEGRPIPKDLLNFLFEPMVRHIQPGAPEEIGSMGLGLYICREIVRAHRGTISASSSAEGTTVFTIVLPRAGAAEPYAPAAPDSRPLEERR
ncbi:sensor histidine kinase [Luteolibacter arcticus]|uniref:histidine kinase n=1 Tax=Luteolibacter arcticus TaxID=1581411 RepID=A0ABT3GKP8_9BACT|nr:sensor histidine kinase [Luteolibacter arcticus]MCW1924077.1 sensor histidine kinase [Luteolibacter arcticus]